MPDRREASGAPDLFLRPEAGRFRAVALIQSFDSRRTVGACLANLVAQGLETYVFDNGSTDGSREIAEGFLGRGVLAVESVPRHGVFEHAALLARKEDVARRIDADWFVHVDTDEILRPPSGFPTVLDALRAADAGGFDAANCFEFIFSPTVEEPDHDHGRFLETMRWYYPFAPQLFHRVSAWKRRTGAIGLVETGGHDVRLPGTRVFPANLVLRHYPILSRAHAAAKYSSRTHPIAPLSRGWHGWRERLDPARVTLPSRSSLRLDDGVSPLDESRPESRHLFVADEAPPAPAPAAGSSSRPAPRALLVLGMHRSGGSALAGCLLGLGVPLGGPLSSPGLDDPSGETFELERVRRLHDALLSSFGASPLDLAPLPAGWERHPIARETRRVLGTLVDELFSSRPLWALQDPRLSILLPLWFPLLAERGIEPRFVLVQRSPGEVAHSLGKKGVPTAAALAAWLAHVENADRLTRGHVRTVVRYADLLDGPVAELERIGTALGFAWPFPPAGERARLETFLQTRRSLRQAAAPPPETEGDGPEPFARLAVALEDAGDPDAPPARIDEAARACHALLADLGWPESGPATEEDARQLEWLAPRIPPGMRAGARYEIAVSFRNIAPRTLPKFALSLSYHWRDAAEPQETTLFEGLRTPVPRSVPPGEREEIVATVEAPPRPGAYLLELDLVREEIAWFSRVGAPGPTVAVAVEN